MADIKIIRRQFISPDRRNIAPFPRSLVGHSIDSDDIKDWSLYVDTPNPHGLSPCGYGLLYEAANYEILCRNLMLFNADYVEKYAMPLTIIDTMKTDDDERQYLEDMIRTLGSSGYIIKDPQDVVTIQSYDKVGDGYKSYADLELRLEKKISKLLLGHADALDAIPGMLGNMGADTPIQRGLDEIETNDSRFVEFWVNDFLLEKLRNCGVRIPDDLVFKYLNNKEKIDEENKELDKLDKLSKILKTMNESGYIPEQKWVEEMAGFKVNVDVELDSTKTKIDPSINTKIQPETNKIQTVFNSKSGIVINSIEDPYKNEHAARIIEPSRFQKDSFRRKNITTGIDVIIGKLIGENKIIIQSYRFDSNIFSVYEAKNWLKEHKIKYISFHPSINNKNGIDIIKEAKIDLDKYNENEREFKK